MPPDAFATPVITMLAAASKHLLWIEFILMI
jgi:hypothetical protein